MWVQGRYRFVSGRFGAVSAVRSLHLDADERLRALSIRDADALVSDEARLGHSHRLVEWLRGLTGQSSESGQRVGVPGVLPRVRRAIETGQLLFVRDLDSSDEPSRANPDSKLLRIVRRIMKQRRHLSLEAASYRLILPIDWERYQEEHQVVRVAEAKAVLQRLTRVLLAPDEQAALEEAVPHLTDKPVTATSLPEGIFLLRRTERPPELEIREAPAASPSKLAKEAKKEEPTWLEVSVLDPMGKPFKGKFKIELPTGEIKEGSFGGSGKIRLEDLDPGSVEVRLPDFESDKKKGQDAA